MAKSKNRTSDSKKKILIIDDEPDIVVYLTTLLEDQNFAVVSAPDGRQGLDLIRREKPDLVCLDIMMPHKTGVAVYQEVKTDPELKNIPCIIISAYESAYTFKGQAFRRLVQNRSIPEPLRFFEKPLDIPVFLDFINGLFRKARKK